MKRIGTLFMLLMMLCTSFCPAAAEEMGSPYSVQKKAPMTQPQAIRSLMCPAPIP